MSSLDSVWTIVHGAILAQVCPRLDRLTHLEVEVAVEPAGLATVAISFGGGAEGMLAPLIV